MVRPVFAIVAVMLMLGHARCEEYFRFLVDIVEPTGDADVTKTMTTVNNILKETDDVDFIFKVVGEPRVLAILNTSSHCNIRAVEKKLLAAKLDITVKSLYLSEKLAADLGVNKTLIESSPIPTKLTGDHIYFWDSSFIMEGVTSEEYKEEIRDNLVTALNYRKTHQGIAYKVLGEFPIQMMYFASLEPSVAELVIWHFNRRKLIFTAKVALVENLDHYLKEYQISDYLIKELQNLCKRTYL